MVCKMQCGQQNTTEFKLKKLQNIVVKFALLRADTIQLLIAVWS